MTSNDDSRHGKKPGGPQSAGKRPFATLDLRPVEIHDDTPAEKTKSTSTSDQDPRTSKSKPASDTSPSQTAQQKKASAPVTDNTSSQSTAQSNAPTEPKTIVKRRGGFFGPLVGGILGGVLALFGGDYVLDRLNVPKLAGSATRSMDGVEARLADLEQQISEADGSGSGSASIGPAVPSDLAQRMEDVKTLTKTVAELSEQQALLRQDLETLQTAAKNEAANTSGTDSAIVDRVAALEQRFTNLADVTQTATDGTSVPQLSALTAKIADLDAKLAAQSKTATAQAVPDETKTKIGEALTTATAAREDLDRLSQTVATTKSTTNRVEQRAEALKTETDKLSESIKILNETTLKMSADISSLRNTLQTELGAVARPSDINAAVTPYKDRISSLENTLTSLKKQEAERSLRAKNVVLSLELEDLRRAVESGKPFAAEMQDVKALAGDAVDLTPLDMHAGKGVASRATLEDTFRPLIHEMLSATQTPQSGSLLSQLVDQAKSVVNVRKVTHDREDTSPEAIVARMEANLKAGNLNGVLKEAEALPEENRAPAKSWLNLVRAHASVHDALAKLNTELKASLSKATLTPSP